jgi:Mn2+/Fe2+ NRAMP family transporter
MIVWGLVVFSSYRRAERFFLVLSLAFLAYPIAAILAHPHWGSVNANLFWPHLLASKSFLFITVALIGTTVTPYMQFYLASAVPDKGIGPAEYKRERIDTIAGTIFACLISVFIIIATAAAIKTRAPLASASQAALALKPVAGPLATELFAIGLLGASALAAAIVPLSAAYAVSEAMGSERSVSKSFKEAPIFLGLFTAQIIIGASIALLPGNLISTLINAQVLNGIITPLLLVYILILANKKSLLGHAANGTIFRTVATACVAIVSVLAVVVLAQTVKGWV